MQQMGRLLNDAQYGDVLEPGSLISLPPAFLTAKPDLPSYDGTKDVRIRFDIATMGRELKEVTVTINGKTLTTYGTTFVIVPISYFTQSQTNVRVLLNAFFKGGNMSEVPLQVWSAPFDVAPKFPAQSHNTALSGDYSTSTDPVRATLEKDAMNQMFFPVDGKAWSYSLDSDFHHGTELYALDLNLSSENDRGADVHAPFSATISVTGVNLEQGRVTFTTSVDGKQLVVNFYHMEHIFQAKTGVNYEGLGEAIHRLSLIQQYHIDTNEKDTMEITKELLAIPEAAAVLHPIWAQMVSAQMAIDTAISNGLTFTQAEVFGKVGNEGHAQGVHLHEDAQVDKEPLDLFAWENAYIPNSVVRGVPIGAKTLAFHYDPSAKTLVNTDEMIALMRADAINNVGKQIGVNLAYAWVRGETLDEMTRVKSMPIDAAGDIGWVRANEDGSTYIENDKAKLWSPSSPNMLWSDISV
jgi:hypothetical protein